MHKSPVEAFAPVFRLRGDTSPLFSSLSVRVATATTAGGLSPSVLSFVSSLELRCAGSSDCGGCWSMCVLAHIGGQAHL